MYCLPFDVFYSGLLPKLNNSTIIAFEKANDHHRELVFMARLQKILRCGYFNELVDVTIRKKIDPLTELHLLQYKNDAPTNVRFVWCTGVPFTSNAQMQKSSGKMSKYETLSNMQQYIPYKLYDIRLPGMRNQWLYAPVSLGKHNIFEIVGKRGMGATTLAKTIASWFPERVLYFISLTEDMHQEWSTVRLGQHGEPIRTNIDELFSKVQGFRYIPTYHIPQIMVIIDSVYVDRNQQGRYNELMAMLNRMQAIVIVTEQLIGGTPFRRATNVTGLKYAQMVLLHALRDGPQTVQQRTLVYNDVEP